MLRSAISLLLVIATTGIARSADPQFPVVRWSGVIADREREKAAPAYGAIASQKEFVELWKEWRGKEDPPQINFSTHFVLVLTRSERKISIVQWSVKEDGDLQFTTATEADKKGEKVVSGFGYAIAVIPRGTVKFVKGKALPESK